MVSQGWCPKRQIDAAGSVDLHVWSRVSGEEDVSVVWDASVAGRNLDGVYKGSHVVAYIVIQVLFGDTSLLSTSQSIYPWKIECDCPNDSRSSRGCFCDRHLVQRHRYVTPHANIAGPSTISSIPIPASGCIQLAEAVLHHEPMPRRYRLSQAGYQCSRLWAADVSHLTSVFPA